MRCLMNVSFRFVPAVVVGVLALAAANTNAAMYTDGYIDPVWQGQPNSTYQEWLGGFTKTGFAATGPNAPTIVSNPAYSATPTPNANAGSPVGFVTSTNGIYHFGAKIQPTTVVPNLNLGSGYNTIVRWQVSFDRIGEWLDMNTVTVTPAGGSPVGLAAGIAFTDKYYDDATATWVYPTALTTSTGTGTYQDLGFFEGIAAGYGEGPDYTKGYLFEWVLPGNVESYTFNALARGTSASFKGAQVDTIAVVVPEPASLSVLALSAVALRRRRRR